MRFSILFIISLAVWGSSLIASLALALRDDQYTHLLLILPVSVALIILDWKSPATRSRSGIKTGAVLLTIAAALTIIFKLRTVPFPADLQLSMNMLTLVLWWQGAFVFSFGTRAFQRALFPLCFLFWLVPLPDFLLTPIIHLLQQGSVASARALFEAFGVPVAQDGTYISLPGLTLEVARECSSIRSSLMLVVTTLVLTQMLLRSLSRKALIVAVSIPLSVAKNGLRIFVLAMLGMNGDPSFLTGRLHRQGGIIYFLIALAAILLLIWLARLGEKSPPREHDGPFLRATSESHPTSRPLPTKQD